jgi:hypothetical protein
MRPTISTPPPLLSPPSPSVPPSAVPPSAVPPSAVPVPLPTISRRPTPTDTLTIDCGDCRHQGTTVCDDCVVSFIVGRQPEDAVVVDADEARAVRMLEVAGLVPGVRHARRVS